MPKQGRAEVDLVLNQRKGRGWPRDLAHRASQDVVVSKAPVTLVTTPGDPGEVSLSRSRNLTLRACCQSAGNRFETACYTRPAGPEGERLIRETIYSVPREAIYSENRGRELRGLGGRGGELAVGVP